MSYEALFRNSGVAEAVETAQSQIALTLQNAGRSISEFTAAAGQPIGKVLSSLGETLISTNTPTGRHYGQAIKAVGDVMDKGIGLANARDRAAIYEWVAKEAIADTSAGLITTGAFFGVAAALGVYLGIPTAAASGSLLILAAANPPAAVVMIFAVLVGAKFTGDFIADNLTPSLLRLASALISFPDPLTLDLDGDGIELSPLGTAGQTGASTVFFDFDGDGFRERTGWVKADDGMLAIDLNGNGLIDNGGELFGQPARDGYEVLETYDTFADGVIDAKDAAFARLRIWRDLDQDGVTDAGELPLMIRMAT